jgi:scyllo-inositol 2-dehydrogenase (NADP+)
MKKINTAIIGFGVGGRIFYAPFVGNLPDFNLKIISTTNPTSIAIAKERYPNTRIVHDATFILNDPDIELVIIGTPNEVHVHWAKAALLHGKHVIVDKPFTVTTAEADELIALSKQQNRILSVHHNRRFVSDFRTVQKVINSGILGNLVEYEAHYDRFRPTLRPTAWREHQVPGAGIWFDLGAHLVDQVLVVFGMPEAVFGDLRKQRLGAQACDHFEVIFNYPNLKVTLKGSMLSKIAAPTFMLHGDQGSFVKYGMDVQENDLKAGFNPKNKRNWGKEPKGIWGTLTTEKEGFTHKSLLKSEIGAYQDYFLNVAKAIHGEADLMVTAQQSRAVIRLIEIAEESSNQKRWINIKSKISDHFSKNT